MSECALELMETLSDPIVVLNREWQICEANKAFCHIFKINRHKLVGRTIYDLFPGLKAKIVDSDSGNQDVLYEYMPAGFGRTIVRVRRICNEVISSDKIVLVFGPISELSCTEKRDNYHRLMAMVAEVADGVAHNFNNLLQVLLGETQLALVQLESGNISKVRLLLESFLERTTIGSETVRRLNEFARLGLGSVRLETSVFDLSLATKKTLDLIRPFLENTAPGAKIELSMDLETGCWVLGKEEELLKAIWNCVINAVEAQPQGGRIVLKSFVKDQHAFLEVHDTGGGIPQVYLDKVFLPFWTTKGFGGRGMGLATAYAIIVAHGGDVSAESRLGTGSVFSIKLPVATRTS